MSNADIIQIKAYIEDNCTSLFELSEYLDIVHHINGIVKDGDILEKLQAIYILKCGFRALTILQSKQHIDKHIIKKIIDEFKHDAFL